MKHVLVIDDETKQGKLVMDLITAINPPDLSISIIEDASELEELIPAEVAFREFKEKLLVEVKRKHLH